MKNLGFLLICALSAAIAEPQREALETDSLKNETDSLVNPMVEVPLADTSWSTAPGQDSLLMSIRKNGAGEMIAKGDLAEVHYRGWLDSGVEFDNSKGRGSLEFPLGAGKVIQGWDHGLVGMKVGEVRRLRVPAKLGYGSQDLGVIPPNSTLNFEVELLGLKKGLKPDTLQEIKNWQTGSRGVLFHREKEGTGQKANVGDRLKIHYTGWLQGGTLFGTSKDSPVPAEFTLGKGEVISGWELGLKDVRKGEVIWLRVPPQLGYGGVPMARIPAHSTLIFRVQIEDVEFSTVQTDLPTLTDQDWKELRAGIKYAMIAEGEGEGVKIGQKVGMHYTGWLLDGTKFDSSIPRGQVFEFQLGAKQVIPGWDLGIEGMKVGEKKLLWIPSNLGYGARGAGGSIPPHADLIFEVERVH